MKRTVVFDIETVAQDTERLLALAPEFKAAANLKDPVKIAASIEEKRAAYLDRAALDWKTASVVLVGFHDGREFTWVTGSETEVVGQTLNVIARMLFDGVFVGGHNIKGFDLPMLINRARVLGVEIPDGILVWFKGRMGWHEAIFDTLEVLSFGRSFEGNGCDDCARVFGLPGKLGSGADFPALWRQDEAAAIAYNRRDCEIEIQLAARCGF